MSISLQKKHPKGLWVLFGTEMWERFNFYGMRAILTLYLVEALRIGESDVSIIYGGFLALCYLTPLLGGFLSDQFLGNRFCITLGAVLMAMGQFFLFYSASVFHDSQELSRSILWYGLFIIIVGNGFFKPNISSMVGSLYPPTNKNRLDSAFTIFYMGINLGALLGQYFVPLIGDVVVNGKRDLHAFRWGFFVAGLGMLLGMIIFTVLKNKFIITPEGIPIGGVPRESKNEDDKKEEITFSRSAIVMVTGLFLVLFLAFRYLLVGEIGFHHVGIGSLIKGIIYPLIYASGISLAVLILTDKSLTKTELQRILVIYIVSVFIIFFWAAFEQAGSSLTFIADKQTDRSILNWEMPASMVQIFNGVFVVLLALPFSALWDRMRSKGLEPSSPLKQAFGLFLIAVAFFIIAHNVKDLGVHGLLQIKWLVLLYFIMTCAELCLSPIGLSLVAKLSPQRYVSLLYGIFFISNASGYALAGSLGAILPATGDKYVKARELGIDLKGVLDKKITLTQEQILLFAHENIPTRYPTFVGFEIQSIYQFFMVFVVLCGIASIVLGLISPLLKKMMHEAKEF
ncbi:MAG: peptide MFS transporter [Bergeyella sp.]|nr:peptide MFS transporter [Bergeyella sp.]